MRLFGERRLQQEGANAEGHQSGREAVRPSVVELGASEANGAVVSTLEVARRSEALGRYVRDWALFLPVLGGLYFIGVRTIYARFYGSFLITPEAVGFGYFETMARSARPVVEVFVAIIPFVVVAGWFVHRGGLRWGNRFAIRLGAVLAAFLLGLVLLLQYYAAAALADRVRDGGAVLPLSPTHLGLTAVPACVSWVGDLPENSLTLDREFVYLGQNDGTVVLFDRLRHETLLLLTGDVAISIRLLGCD